LNPSKLGLTGKVQWGQQSQPVKVQKILTENKPYRVARVIKKQDRVQSGPHGIVVDLGALNAVRSGAELYPVGVLQVQGEFSTNQRISMYNHHGQKIAECTALYSSSEIKKIKGKQSKEIKRILKFSRGDSVVSDVQF
jgi:glutamate 5-kinase